MILGSGKGAFIAAGVVMYVGELKFVGAKETPKLDFSVSTHKNADGKSETTFLTAWGTEAEHIGRMGLAKWDVVLVAGTWSKSENKKDPTKPYVNYNVEFIARQCEIAPIAANMDDSGADDDEQVDDEDLPF